MQELGAKIDETMIDRSLPRLKAGLDVLRDNEFRAVELPVHGLDAIRNGRLDYARVMHVRELLADYDFRYSVHSPDPLNLMDEDDQELHIAVLKASIEFSLLINAAVLVYHPGRYIPEELFMLYEKGDLSSDDKRKLLDKEALLLQRIADEYPEMTICMENSRPYLFHSPYCYAERLGPLAEQVEHINRKNVKINLDFGHLYLSSKHYGFDAVTAVEEVRQHIGHTHIHDNFGKVIFHHEKQQTRLIPFGKGDSHMPVGWGEIPFEKILSVFIEKYEGMFMMELRGRYFDSVLESRDNLRVILASCLPQQAEKDLAISDGLA
jgi:sugar phosphate isomerase/epimerase